MINRLKPALGLKDNFREVRRKYALAVALIPSRQLTSARELSMSSLLSFPAPSPSLESPNPASPRAP